MVSVASIHIYRVKSTAASALVESVVEPRGLQGDRRWMVVDDQGHFLTGRRHPKLTQIHTTVSIACLQCQAPGQADLAVPLPKGEHGELAVSVWKDKLNVFRTGNDVSAWFSDYLGTRCHLVYMHEHHLRPVDPQFSRSHDIVSFADGYPLLLISQASLDDLNQRAQTHIKMAAFRPNLVVRGCAAYGEDQWQSIQIGKVIFDVAKACRRCVFTTIDPDSGKKTPYGEPLTTLMTYRRHADAQGVFFGQNLIARSAGKIAVGDSVQVLSVRATARG